MSIETIKPYMENSGAKKSLLRAMRQKIKVIQAKGCEVAPITRQKLHQQLYQLTRDQLVEQLGYCWRLRS